LSISVLKFIVAVLLLIAFGLLERSAYSCGGQRNLWIVFKNRFALETCYEMYASFNNSDAFAASLDTFPALRRVY